MGCAGTSQPVNVSGLRGVLGDTLGGARGETLEDQERIDSTMARGCANGIFSSGACARHTDASFERRIELSPMVGDETS